MLYGFLLILVVALGVFGFFSIAARKKSDKKESTVSTEYEIIEDNG